MSSKLLTEWFPGTQIPVISAAPMFTATNGKLAAAVSGAGGLGI